MTAFEFFKSSHSDTGGNCVEVARNVPRVTAVRDSNAPAGPRLAFGAAAWASFIESLQDGDSASL
ncbi:DUF397 domain-containing protein [Streptomyces chattanoogensis]|uniref:DUF397 domain-containing protein n=1 Tax=Streptomyces chattanoogensis TaxID=66876 RepID=UPI0036798058